MFTVSEDDEGEDIDDDDGSQKSKGAIDQP